MKYNESEWKQWLISEQTKEFFRLLAEEKDLIIDSLLNLTSSSSELAKDFYSRQGQARGFIAAYNFAVNLSAEKENKNEK